MKGKRFTEQQIIGVLKESEVGANLRKLCRKHGIAAATFYNWKAKFSGLTVSEARRLKELEAENAKLKRAAALGPFLELAVSGILAIKLEKQDGTITAVVTCRVSGDPARKLDQLAPIVDQVLGMQFGAFAAEAGK